MTRSRLPAACLLVGGALLLAGCAVFDRHSLLTIETLLSEVPGAVDVTDTVCDETIDCVEAVRTDEADYLRFDSRSAATEFADTLADGFVMHYIVMDFAGKTATKEQQQWAMERLAGAWQDYDGPYPER